VHTSAQIQWLHEKRGSLKNATLEFIKRLPLDQDGAFDRPPIYFHHVTCDVDYLIVVLHHSLYDGISLPLLFQLVRELYFDCTKQSNLPQFWTISRRMAATEAAGTQYWTSRLQNVKPCLYPRQNPTSVNAWRAQKQVELPVSSIQRFCQRYQIAPQAIAQAAWAAVLASSLRRLDVVFGHVVSGRTLRDSENVIGPVFVCIDSLYLHPKSNFFQNTIPCRVTLAKQSNWKELVRSVHQSNLDCFPWQHASLRSIHQAIGVSAICDTLFLFQPGGAEETPESGLWRFVSRPADTQTKSQVRIQSILENSL
jgi:hypothetical protein